MSGLSADKLALLEQRLRGGADALRPSLSVQPGGRPDRAPLSPAQEQLWYFGRLAPENPVYNEIVSIRKDGPVELAALRLAFNELVSRHEIWRSTFEIADGEPVQVVHPPRTHQLPLIDLEQLPAPERETAAARMAAAEARLPYDLEHGPLLRPLLMRFSAHHHRLYLAMHHLIFDGVSLYRIVLPELVMRYDDLRACRERTLPAPIQYGAYAETARRAENGRDHRRRVAHWRRHLSQAPTLQLPLDHTRPSRQRFRGSMRRVRIPREVVEELRSLSRTSGTTLFQVLAAAYSVLLHRYSEQDDVVFGTFVDMRNRPELEGMVGYCLSALVLRVDMSGEPSFTELLQRVRDELLDGLDNLVPFERLVRELRPPRGAAINPLFQVAITLEPAMVAVDPAWSLHQMEAEASDAVGNAKFDLLLELDERPEGHLDGRLIFDRDLFSPPTADRLVACWTTLLEGIAADPGRPARELPLLDAAQRRRQLVDWNATAMPYPRDTCLHDLLAAQVSRTPDAVAAVFGGQRLTYRELDERADRLAARLAARNHERAPVAIYLERSLEMLVAMLGVLKSGAPYVPLDLGHPAQRLEWMIADSGAALLLTDSALAGRLTGHSARVVCLDEGDCGEADGSVPVPPATAQDIAYILYTSGSTGTPKGVCITHRCLVNLLCSWTREPGLTSRDTIVAITTYAFDIAAVELWLALLTGARMVIASREVAADGRRLAGLLDDDEITVMQATPATWQMLIDAGWSGRPGLTAVSTGEPLAPRLAEQLLARTDRLWNMYGPTETTIHSTAERIEPGTPVTIGRPIANTRTYVLDRRRQPVPVGVSGELAIAGDGVGRGYLNRSALTSERFVADPFVDGERMYLTGDLARYLPDGRIEHLGRLDRQIKIRGFRVEPGEIEAALTGESDIANAVVVARGRGPTETRLIAYVVPRGRPPTARELRARLLATLPGYMVPAAFVSLDELPLTANGKLDHAALPEPQPAAAARAGPSPTRTAAQQAMAAIWERVLGLERVEIDDDFFELGGHSLLALRLLVEVQHELGVEVPLSAFFAGGGVTVAGLSDAVTRASEPAADAGERDDASLALFFVHPHVSTMLILRHFAAPLGADWQLVGLLPDRVDGRFDRSQTVESIVAPMLDTVRRTQPHGPYYIAGYSLGGLLAYALAGQLRACGERVAWLGVLDAATPAADTRWWQREFTARRRLARQWQRGPRGAWAELEESVRRELTSRLIRLRLRRVEVSEEFDWLGAMKLTMRYRCPPHDAPMDLFVTEARAAGARSDSLGWSDLHAGRLRVHRVPGDHDDMVTPGHVDAVADLVSAGVKEARGGRIAS